MLNVERILREASRTITEEALAFIGLGSIGLSVLRLMLRILPHPRRIVLCDLFSRKARLAEVGREIRAIFGGEVELAEAADGTVPAAIYQMTLIVAATNVPEVVDVSLAAPRHHHGRRFRPALLRPRSGSAPDARRGRCPVHRRRRTAQSGANDGPTVRPSVGGS